MEELLEALGKVGLSFKVQPEKVVHIFRGGKQIGCVHQEGEEEISFHFHWPGKIEEPVSTVSR